MNWDKHIEQTDMFKFHASMLNTFSEFNTKLNDFKPNTFPMPQKGLSGGMFGKKIT